MGRWGLPPLLFRVHTYLPTYLHTQKILAGEELMMLRMSKAKPTRPVAYLKPAGDAGDADGLV